MALSPLMKQYLEVKQEHPDCILMCRIGDFYEMFFDDAKTASRELDLVLTGKDCGLDERAPMCGVPHHAVESYIAKLVSRGYRVAICEQMEDPATAKGLVKREVIRIITPVRLPRAAILTKRRTTILRLRFATISDAASPLPTFRQAKYPQPSFWAKTCPQESFPRRRRTARASLSYPRITRRIRVHFSTRASTRSCLTVR